MRVLEIARLRLHLCHERERAPAALVSTHTLTPCAEHQTMTARSTLLDARIFSA
jgi:hypothetical protein